MHETAANHMVGRVPVARPEERVETPSARGFQAGGGTPSTTCISSTITGA
jgi:hypothetical protein